MTTRSLTANLLPFLTGVVIGVLATLGTFSGRVSALETIAAEHSKQLDKIDKNYERLSDEIITALRR